MKNKRGFYFQVRQEDWDCHQPRLIEIYMLFTLKKSFCTLYHESCQLWPWGQSTHVFKENKGLQNGGIVTLKEWLFSCYASLREREQHVCSSYWVWEGWGLRDRGWKETYCIMLADGCLWCPQSSTKMGKENVRMSVGKLYSAPCSQRGALPLLMENPDFS